MLRRPTRTYATLPAALLVLAATGLVARPGTAAAAGPSPIQGLTETVTETVTAPVQDVDAVAAALPRATTPDPAAAPAPTPPASTPADDAAPQIVHTLTAPVTHAVAAAPAALAHDAAADTPAAATGLLTGAAETAVQAPRQIVNAVMTPPSATTPAAPLRQSAAATLSTVGSIVGGLDGSAARSTGGEEPSGRSLLGGLVTGVTATTGQVLEATGSGLSHTIQKLAGATPAVDPDAARTTSAPTRPPGGGASPASIAAPVAYRDIQPTTGLETALAGPVPGLVSALPAPAPRSCIPCAIDPAPDSATALAAGSIVLPGSSHSIPAGSPDADMPAGGTPDGPAPPAPAPPSGIAAASSAGGLSGPSGTALFLMLSCLSVLAGPWAMRRLRLASQSLRPAPLVLIPERPG